MSTAHTTRPLDPTQLAVELAVAAGLDAPAGLAISTSGEESEVVAFDVDEATLQAVVDAHVPEAPKTVPDNEELAAMIDELADLMLGG